MSSIADFSRVTHRAVLREQGRAGTNYEDALAAVAWRIRIGSGTLANIARKRVKSVSFDVGASIIAYAVNDITRQIERLEHERRTILEIGADHDPHALERMAREIASAQETLNEVSAVMAARLPEGDR